MKLRLNNKEENFSVCQSMKKPIDMHVISVIITVDEESKIAPIEESLGVEAPVIVIINFEVYNIDEYYEMVSTFVGIGSYSYAPNSLDLDLEHKVTPPAKPSIMEASCVGA